MLSFAPTRSALEAQGAQIVRALGGHWTGRGGMCRCPAHDDRDPSLSVRLGDRSLLFHCFAGCDGTDIIRVILRRRLLEGERLVVADQGTRTSRDTDLHARLARQLWEESRPIAGTLAERYLASRRLYGPMPALRFHPRTPLGSGRALRFRPAMIAAITEGRQLVGIQRTFLDPATAAKASDLPKPKLMLGRPHGGAVRLAAAGATLGIAEGLETAWSAMILLGLPVWAVLGSERFARVRIPDSVRHLVLLPDRGAAGRRAVAKSHDNLRRPGLIIEPKWPFDGHDDWSDVLMASLEPCPPVRSSGGGG